MRPDDLFKCAYGFADNDHDVTPLLLKCQTNGVAAFCDIPCIVLHGDGIRRDGTITYEYERMFLYYVRTLYYTRYGIRAFRWSRQLSKCRLASHRRAPPDLLPIRIGKSRRTFRTIPFRAETPARVRIRTIAIFGIALI